VRIYECLICACPRLLFDEKRCGRVRDCFEGEDLPADNDREEGPVQGTWFLIGYNWCWKVSRNICERNCCY
jgi:hypothetical protein